MARIVTVCAGDRRRFVPVDMWYIRWFAMAAALARLGHEVDIATAEPGLRRVLPVRMAPRLRRVPLGAVRWERYDVVKTEFHVGFETLERHGGAGHPCIVSNLGSVVDREDAAGVYFKGPRRAALFAVQERIAARSRWVTVLTAPSLARWRGRFGDAGAPFLVPGAADDVVPAPGSDPYPPDGTVRCLFAGNVYDAVSQAEAHATLVAKLEALGRRLAARGARLYLMGTGDTRAIDPHAVEVLGPVAYDRSWDWLRHAHVGVVLALGPHPNENESTKIYHYLRVGLPTVCEAGFPNQDLVTELGLGCVVPNGDLDALADAVISTARGTWDRRCAVEAILAHHTWIERAGRYAAALGEAG
jgi:glycosyltransferase involved in cell wall biosynthesis